MTHLDALLREQIAHAYQNAPAFKKIMDDAGVKPADIQTVADLARIPITTKDRLQEMQQANPPFGGFLAVPIQQLQRIYISPGPIYDPHGFGDEAAENAAQEAFEQAGFTAEDIVINTFMYHMVPAGLLLDAVGRQIGATVVPMGPGNLEVQVKVIMDLGVTAYVGTTSFLQMIYDKAGEFGIPPEKLPLKKAFFTAELYTPAQRQKYEGDYKLITSQAYGTADLGIIGYEPPGVTGFYVPQNLIVQICDPQTGEELEYGQPGDVVVTTFNKTYPLIRFSPGDLSALEITTDKHGNPQRKLLGLLGRSGEAIKVRGMFLHPNALKKALASFPNIKTFQAVVGREGTRDTVTLHLVLENGSIDTEAVAEAVKNAARLSVNAVEVVEQVEGTRLVRDTRTYN